MEEIKFYPVFTTPFGFSSKEPSSIVISSEKELPDIIRKSEGFEVVLIGMDDTVEFAYGATSGNVYFVDGKAEIPAKLKEGSEGAQIKALFTFNVRFCGMVETFIPRMEIYPDVVV